MALDKDQETALKIAAVIALLLLLWRLFGKKKLVIGKSVDIAKKQTGQFNGQPINCDDLIHKPTVFVDIPPGDESIFAGKTVTFGDRYADEQARMYCEQKQGEALRITNRKTVHFKLINSTDESITTGVLDTTQDEVPFDPLPDAPVVNNPTNITGSGFTLGWSAVSGATKYYLDLSTNSNFTSYVTGYENTDVGNVVTLGITGLTENTTYYARIRAYNGNAASNNSNIVSATTIFFTTVTDLDGNIYDIITIGNQQWLVQNLKTTKYGDETAIPNLTDNADWMAEDGTPGHDGAYSWYDNEIANKSDFGAIYNWHAVNNAKGLATNQFKNGGVISTGWRVPTDDDFNTLIAFLGGESVAGDKIKESGITHWANPNAATDDYGFALRSGGYRCGADGLFWNGADDPLVAGSLGYTALWSSTEYNATDGGGRWCVNDASFFNFIHDVKTTGNYVRCVRDI